MYAKGDSIVQVWHILSIQWMTIIKVSCFPEGDRVTNKENVASATRSVNKALSSGVQWHRYTRILSEMHLNGYSECSGRVYLLSFQVQNSCRKLHCRALVQDRRTTADHTPYNAHTSSVHTKRAMLTKVVCWDNQSLLEAYAHDL